METLFAVARPSANCLFKSYYVVWKRENPNCQVQAVGVFKSYYVVWKLEKQNKRCEEYIV